MKLKCLTPGCGNERETNISGYHFELTTQYAPTFSFLEVLPEFPAVEPSFNANCVKCTEAKNHELPIEEHVGSYNIPHERTVSFVVMPYTKYFILYYVRHGNNLEIWPLKFQTCPNKIQFGSDLDGPVHWQLETVILKTGGQEAGHYWAYRCLNDIWLEVNDSKVAMKQIRNLGTVSEQISMIILRKIE
jgi:ubiquitin C-terminal hydrolase